MCNQIFRPRKRLILHSHSVICSKPKKRQGQTISGIRPIFVNKKSSCRRNFTHALPLRHGSSVKSKILIRIEMEVSAYGGFALQYLNVGFNWILLRRSSFGSSSKLGVFLCCVLSKK